MNSTVFLLACLAAAAFGVYVPFMAVAAARLQIGIDYSAPRAMFDKLPDWAKRATWAHQNAFEGFALYAAAVLMVVAVGKTGELASALAFAYLPFRLAHGIFYIVNWPILRSLAWGGAILATFALMAVAMGVLN